MFEIPAISLILALGACVWVGARGRTMFDQLLASNSAGTCAVLLISIIGFLTDRPEFLDLALVYCLLNVVSTIAVLKYFKYGNLGGESQSDISLPTGRSTDDRGPG
jgi:multicomponent Na+:H+ antiporter subunit F